MIDREAKAAIVAIYIVMLLVASPPTIPFMSGDDYYSLAILNHECKLGGYIVTYYQGSTARYCVYIANHAKDSKILQARIILADANETASIGNYTVLLLPETNATFHVSIPLNNPGNYTLAVKLYILEDTKWEDTGLQANLTLTVYRGPGSP